MEIFNRDIDSLQDLKAFGQDLWQDAKGHVTGAAHLGAASVLGPSKAHAAEPKAHDTHAETPVENNPHSDPVHEDDHHTDHDPHAEDSHGADHDPHADEHHGDHVEVHHEKTPWYVWTAKFIDRSYTAATEGMRSFFLQPIVKFERKDGMAQVEVTDTMTTSTQVEFPTDLLPLDNGDLVLVDSINNSLVLQTPTGTKTIPLDTPAEWGQPVRVTQRSAGGYWVTYPSNIHAQGWLAAIDEQGKRLETHSIPIHDTEYLQPVTVIEWGEDLIIGGRDNGIARYNPQHKEVIWHTDDLGFDKKLNTVADINISKDGIMVIDPLSAWIHTLDEDGHLLYSFRDTGGYTGELITPKSIALTNNGRYLVVDSQLCAVQLFDTDWTYLGSIFDNGELQAVQHALAIRKSPSDNEVFYVLNQSTGQVLSFRLTELAEQHSIHNPETKYAMTPLMSPTQSASGVNGSNCQICHDGIVQDVWNVDLEAGHPIGMKPSFEVPAPFRLHQGELACESCHSPHAMMTGHRETDAEIQASADFYAHGGTAGTFTRVQTQHGNICIACHGDSPHTVATASAEYYSHPMAEELMSKMLERKDRKSHQMAQEMGTGCDRCHEMSAHAPALDNRLKEFEEGSSCNQCHSDKTVARRNHFTGYSDNIYAPNGDFASISNTLWETENFTPSADTNEGAFLEPDHTGNWWESASEPSQDRSDLTRSSTTVSCASCHDMASAVSEKLVTTSTDYASCFECHSDKGGIMGGKHAQIEDPYGTGTMCFGCHPSMHADRGQTLASTTQSCNHCHNPNGDQPIPQDKIKPAGQAGHPLHSTGNEDCSLCHWTPDTHQLRTASLDNCGACHSKPQGMHNESSCQQCHPSDAAPVWGNASGVGTCKACHVYGKDPNAPRIASNAYQHSDNVFHPNTPLEDDNGNPYNHRGLPLAKTENGYPNITSGAGYLNCLSCHPGMHTTGSPQKTRGGAGTICNACHDTAAFDNFHSPNRSNYKQ